MLNIENRHLGQCCACSGTVSKKAKTCPHCGQKKPARGPIVVPKPIAWGIIGVTLITVVPMLFTGPPSSSSSTSASSNYSNPSKQQNWILTSQDGVRSKLKDPGSAKFKDSFFVVWKNTPVVCGSVNSKNSMGGYGGFQRFVASGTSIAYLEEEVADFANVWREMCQK